MESKAVMNQEFVKLDRFDGTNFTRWKDKMMFLLTALKISYILNPALADLSPPNSDEDEQTKKDRSKREEDELLCRGHILNNLSDRLYDLFTSVKTAKEIWSALEFKYNNEKQGVEKFLIMKYFEFSMVDNVSVMDQVHELQILVSKLKDVKVEVPESLQVGGIIAKLPPSWNGYVKKLLHTAETFSLEQIQKHLRIEEETRLRANKFSNESTTKVNFVEGKQKTGGGNKRKFSETNSGNGISQNGNSSKFSKAKTCYHCGKKGHFKRECRLLKKQKPNNAYKSNNAQNSNNANLVEADALNNLVAMVSDLHIGMVTELHMAAVTKSDDWWYDSGATIHVCNNKSQFKDYEIVDNGDEVLMGNHNSAKVMGKGSVELQFTSSKKILLVNVLHVPDIRKNLMSANVLNKKGFKVVLESDKLILSKNGMFVGKGYSCDGMFKLSIINNKMPSSAYIVELSLSLWHDRLAHISPRSLKFMAKQGLINYDQDSMQTCEVCIQAKMTKKPFPKVERTTCILELVHTDICELNGILTRGGNRYFITFIDDFTKFTYVYLMRNKDQAFDMFKVYKSEVENQKDKKIKVLRSDRGGEYFSMEFSSFCEESGIIHQATAPYTPQQNGLAERKNRTLVEMVNAMLINAKLPTNLWGEALLTACYLHNRIPSRKSKVSPYELWKNRKPNLGYLRVWGCLAFYRVPDPKRVKLGPRALKGIFVGYAENSKAYRILDLSSNVIVESRDVDFIENKFQGDSQNIPKDSNPNNEPTNIVNKDVDPSSSNKRKNSEFPIVVRKSQRVRKEKNLHPDYISSQSIVFLVEGDRTTVLNKIPILLNIEDDPQTFQEAMSSRDVAFWKEAINDEMDSLISNNTWIIVDLPPSSKPIGCKWVFRRKYNTDGSLQTFKARLVAKGFKQKEGIDYFDTYAPVARITSIRVLLALASLYNLFVHQMDVKTAFLNGELDEEVYMEQPEGFILPGNEKKVCKLTKSLYGLKQAPKQWHEKFDSVILEYGFQHNVADKCIYSKFTENYGVIICLYVDDMLIIGTNMDGVQDTKKYLSSQFKMKDLNEVDTILGIKVKKHNGGFALSQSHYIEKVLTKFKHLNIKEANTPYDVSSKLVENSGRTVAQIEYASAIGSLMYAMHCTRPDIAFSVCKLSRFTINPSVDHWKAIGRVLGYLKRTINYGLFYNTFPSVVEGYSDASWITSTNDNKSTSGWIFTIGGGAVSWASKKQTCITHSTMESEFIALAAAGKEAEWLRNLLLDIKLWPQPMPAISLYCDSQATMSRAFSKIYNGKSRHISLRHEYVRQLITDGVVTIIYIRSCKNLADPFTKGLSRDLIKSTAVGMGLRSFN